MSNTRDILLHVSVETAVKKRKCHHSRGKHFIAAGENFLSLRNSGGLGSKNYCRNCARPILDEAKKKLEVTLLGLNVDTSQL